MDTLAEGKKNKKYTDDGWRCPFCHMWYEFHASWRHLNATHADGLGKMITEAALRTPLERKLPNW